MAIHFSCPHCGNETQVDPKYAGQTGPCGACGRSITIPGPGGSVPPMAEKPSSSTMTCLIIGVIGAVAVFVIIGILIALMIPAVGAARKAAGRMHCSNTLKRLALGMHNYHDTNKSFPPAYSTNPQGERMTSWRIRVLPYLTQTSLHEEYDFDQPWDSEHNLEVASRIPPDVFQCVENEDVSGGGEYQYKVVNGYRIPVSHYVMITGPNTIGAEGKGVEMSKIVDGTSNTLMFVEIRGGDAPAVTEPVDITLEELKRGINTQADSGPGSYHPGGMNTAFCDGSVHFIPETISAKDLENFATINDGNRVSLE